MARCEAIKHWRFLKGPKSVYGMRFRYPSGIWGYYEEVEPSPNTAATKCVVDGEWYKHEEMCRVVQPETHSQITKKQWLLQKLKDFTSKRTI